MATHCPDDRTNPQDSDAVSQQVEGLCKQWECEAKELYNKTLNGNPQDDDVMAELKKASVDGFDLRGALGQRFGRASDGGSVRSTWTSPQRRKQSSGRNGL